MNGSSPPGPSSSSSGTGGGGGMGEGTPPRPPSWPDILRPSVFYHPSGPFGPFGSDTSRFLPPHTAVPTTSGNPFHHHHGHPSASSLLSNTPWPLSPGYAAHHVFGPRPPYLDPAAFLAGSLPRYRYLGLPRLPQGERSHSESSEARWRRPLSPPKPPPPLLPSFGTPSEVRLPSTARPALPTQPYYPSHFMRGTIIQLANGELKRVEDLNTEDFVRSANLSAHLKMDSSTVVRVEEKSKDTVLLCFSVGEHKVQVSVEATVEHPFFVIGQGWSSCSPERTRTLYGLPCQRLAVGDICISLTHRDLPPPANPPPPRRRPASQALPPPRPAKKLRGSAALRRRSLPPRSPPPNHLRRRRTSSAS